MAKKRKASGPKKSSFPGIRHVVHISTNVGRSCELCDYRIHPDSFDESVNHYIESHGFTLLHVGQETSADDDGKPWHSTVAVLGTKSAVKPKKPGPIETELREVKRQD